MEKQLTNFLKNSKVLLILSLVITVLLAVVLAPPLVLSKFENWNKLKKLNQEQTSKLANISTNLSLLTKVGKEKAEKYKELVDKILPNDNDALRVVAIVDKIAKSSGLTLESVTVKSTSAQQIVSPKVGPGTPNPTPTPTPRPITTQTATDTSKASSYSIEVTLHGNLSEAVSFLQFVGNVKRAVGISAVTLTKSSSAAKSVITILFDLPMGSKPSVTADQRLELSEKEQEDFENLFNKLTIDATPSARPLGNNSI